MSDSMSSIIGATKASLLNDRLGQGKARHSTTTANQASADRYDPAAKSARSLSVVQERLYGMLRSAQSLSAINMNKVAQSRMSGSAISASAANSSSSAHENGAVASGEKDYSPNAVSKRIVGFVGNYMEKLKNSGADDKRIAEAMSVAREAVDKGLADAKDKLKALDWLTGDVQSQIDETESKIYKGLDALQEKLFPSTSDQSTSGVSVAITASTSLAAASSVSRSGSNAAVGSAGVSYQSQTLYSQSASNSIEIHTKDGDTVSLSLAALQSYQQSEGMQLSDSGASYGRYQSSSSGFAFEFNVTGQLDKGELDAITGLVKGLAGVADSFFSGDMASAFQQGMSLGYNSSELAGFSMDLQYSQSYRKSQVASVYGDVQTQGQDQRANVPGRSIVQPLRDYAQSLAEVVKTIKDTFSQMQSSVQSTMDSIMAMRADNEKQQAHLAELFDFNKHILDAIFNPPFADKALPGNISDSKANSGSEKNSHSENHTHSGKHAESVTDSTSSHASSKAHAGGSKATDIKHSV